MPSQMPVGKTGRRRKLDAFDMHGAWMYLCIYGMYVCMYVWMDGWMDVWMYGCMDVWMYGCMDVWMYGCMDVCMDVCIYIYLFIYII